MRIKGKFLEFLADICVKIFQIVFAMLVIGMFLREKFEATLFFMGLGGSFLVLIFAVILFYNGSIKGDE